MFERLEQYGFRTKKKMRTFSKLWNTWVTRSMLREFTHYLARLMRLYVLLNHVTSRNYVPRAAQLLRKVYTQILSTLIHPLNSLLPKSKKWVWTPDCKEAFEQAKEVLSYSSVLIHYEHFLAVRRIMLNLKRKHYHLFLESRNSTNICRAGNFN